jgi:hypothetical protein
MTTSRIGCAKRILLSNRVETVPTKVAWKPAWLLASALLLAALGITPDKPSR